jgi:adenylate kinase
MEILIITGLPHSGLGNIIEKINKSLNYHHLSLIHLIRQEVATETSIGQSLRIFMDKGEVLPSSLVQEVLENAIKKCVEKKGILIEGYPRSPLHAELLLDFLSQNPKNRIKACFLSTPKEAIIARLKSKHHWEDSDEALILEQLNNSELEANELKTYLESRIEVMTIDGEGTIEEVVSRVLDAL